MVSGNFAFLIVFNIGVIFYGSMKVEAMSEIFGESVIDYVNNQPDVLWKATKYARFKTIDDLKELLGDWTEAPPIRWNRMKMYRDLKNIELPDQFDARENWPQCATIAKIRDQSRCGSCWAFAATGTMSDRLCIHSNSTINVDLSVRDLISCCPDCGYGCEGGYSRLAWKYWITDGIVTGGTMEEGSGCQPYPFPACNHTYNQVPAESHPFYPPCPSYPYDTPKCQKFCVSGYHIPYHRDRKFGKSVYDVASDEKQIMREIMLNGPVQASMSVYSDFAYYHSGIYHHTMPYYVGAHAVRIVGWGVQDGTPYWLVANSWNAGWGEKGFFRILRGKDECAIESTVIAGLPHL